MSASGTIANGDSRPKADLAQDRSWGGNSRLSVFPSENQFVRKLKSSLAKPDKVASSEQPSVSVQRHSQ